MEFRLTFQTLAIGSLGFCLSILATAWVKELYDRYRDRPARGAGWDGGGPRGSGRYPVGPVAGNSPRPGALGEFNLPRSFATDPGRPRRGPAWPVPRRYVG
jgi:hypothetical protein